MNGKDSRKGERKERGERERERVLRTLYVQ